MTDRGHVAQANTRTENKGTVGVGGAPVASQTAAVSQGIVPPKGGGGSAAPHGLEKPREAQKRTENSDEEARTPPKCSELHSNVKKKANDEACGQT